MNIDPPRRAAVYHVARREAWLQALREGVYRGGPDCLRDGFIHFSEASQVRRSLARHFAGEDDLVLLAAAPETLGPDLRWEASAGGDLYPHFYGVLAPGQLVEIGPVERDAEGRHRLPEGFADGAGA